MDNAQLDITATPTAALWRRYQPWQANSLVQWRPELQSRYLQRYIRLQLERSNPVQVINTTYKISANSIQHYYYYYYVHLLLLVPPGVRMY